MKKDSKQEKAITLVSLIVTMVIIIILAGISLQVTIGEDGIITKTKQAKENIMEAGRAEQEQLNLLYYELANGKEIEDEADDISELIKELDRLKKMEEEYNKLLAQLARTNVTEEKILKNYIAYSQGKLMTGTMANNGAIKENLNCGQSYTIPAGYHNGSGKIIANSLASQTQATATSSDIVTGKNAWVNGNLLTGTNKGYEVGYQDGYDASSYTVLKFTKKELGNSATKANIASCYEKYEQLELWKNLFVCATANYANHTGATGGHTFSYNASTGILTIGSTNNIAPINNYTVYIIDSNKAN